MGFGDFGSGGEYGEIWKEIVFLKDVENLRNIKMF